MKVGLAAAIVCALAGSAVASAATTVTISGRGWGHGVGMSQWGAYGYAQHGWSWQRILAHYYPGTQIGTAPAQRVRVLLAAGRPTVRIGCASALHVGDRAGRGYELPAGSYALDRRLVLPVGRRRVELPGGKRHGESALVLVVNRALPGPVALSCGGAPATLAGHAYRGTLVVRRAGAGLVVVNGLVLDDYVRGVVAAEMPHRWSLAALEAQAVAARSYALATRKPHRHFDVYSDTRSQVYGGIAYETPKSNVAVDRTARKIVTWHGRVATTFFFSTSGGRTADVRDIWPKLARLAYLRSVPDPYDARSPHHAWGPIAFDARRLARRLGARPGPIRPVRSPSGRVSAVFVGRRRIAGADFARALGLDSTWFDASELSLVRSRVEVPFGGRLTLTARVAGVERARLQRRVGAAAWKTFAVVHGSTSVTVEPRAQTLYRLAAGAASGAVVGVAVAPLLEVTPAGDELLEGSVSPPSRGAVTIRRRDAGGWQVVSRPRLDPGGTFRTQLRLRPGAYRITVDGDRRYAAATAHLRVTHRLLASLAK